jgi:hypothetical protein
VWLTTYLYIPNHHASRVALAVLLQLLRNPERPHKKTDEINNRAAARSTRNPAAGSPAVAGSSTKRNHFVASSKSVQIAQRGFGMSLLCA